MTKESEAQKSQHVSMDSIRQSSQHMSMGRSISRGSSGAGNSSRRGSFSASFGVPTSTVGFKDSANKDAEDPTKESPPQVPLSRLASLNKPEIPVLLLGGIAAIINGTIFPIFGILISSAIASFFKSHNELRKDASFWALMFVLLGGVSLLVIPAQGYFFSLAGCKLVRRIRELCFEKVVRMEVGWFDEPENSSGCIGARLSADAATIRALVGDALGQLVQNASSAITGVVIAFTACWELAFIILFLLPLVGISGYFQVKFLKGFSSDAKVFFSCFQ